ncbi:hypothetical protein F5148DRAFT_1283361 [Russula earlei]|uniref:Uncharacterized protein n=1 Tax=Russula earlei TaxID=71964 RepID=A0ACC0UCH2_9AGAM|nr:hypothetical protein F5148DRAFT_1283361 [Russula earlei]
MSVDPYHQVQSEMQSSLQAAEQLLVSFTRIGSTAREGNEELELARNELKETLFTLEADLRDLEESVKIVETTGARMFGLDDREVIQRRRYVGHVRSEIEKMRAEIEGRPRSDSAGPSTPHRSNTHSPFSGSAHEPTGEDHQNQWARQEQQVMIQQQDQAINSIAGTLSTIAQQAGLMGSEISEHNEMLDDLDHGVDRTESKLTDAMRRMRKLVRETEGRKEIGMVYRYPYCDLTHPTCRSHLGVTVGLVATWSDVRPNSIGQATTASTRTFVEALVLNAIIAAAAIVVFTLVRRYFPLIYEPRSLSAFGAKRQQPLSPRLLGWIISIINADYQEIKDINGLDCYFFIRFLRMMVRITLPISLLSWAVLLPLTSVETNVAGHTGLDKFIFGNIADTQQSRYAGHVALTWIFTIWTWWNIRHEMKHYVHVRQEFLVSHAHSSTAQACTVLVTGIPPEYLSESALTRLFSNLPGGVRKVWINRDLKDIPDLYDRRLKACNTLESAGTSLLSMAVKCNNKKRKKAAKAGSKDNGAEGDPEAARKAPIKELVPKQDWPSHRLPPFSWLPFSIPFIGKKVDTIEWAREQVHELNTELKQRHEILARDIAKTTASGAETTVRTHHITAGKLSIDLPAVPVTIPLVGSLPAVSFSDQTYPPANGAFIQFNKQIAAHMAAQTITHHAPYRMSESLKYIEVAPGDVIWENLVMNPYERRVRLALSWAATIAIIILFAIPVAFVGFLSNIRSLCSTYHWLAWVCKAPPVIVNVVQGFASTLFLALLFMLVPIILRIFARFEGIPLKKDVELSLMNRFFLFQVFNGFLIVSFSSGIVASLPSLVNRKTGVGSIVNNPTGIPTLLAQNLPKSSTFFLTFVILQGLAGTAVGFLQIVPLVLYYVKITLLASTPRSVQDIKYSPRTSEWGTLFPTMTQLAVITFGYSIISPIINGLAFGAFLLFYLLYKYLFTWVNNQPASGDTGGLFFPKAIQHIFVGLYVQQLCLCALFFIAQNDRHTPSAIPEGALVVVLIIFTAFFHDTILNSYGPLIKALPLTLADSAYDAVETKADATTDAPNPIPSISENIKAIDYADASASKPFSEGRSTLPDSADDNPLKPLPDKPSTSSRLLPMQLTNDNSPTEFRHPATMGQQVIWLPKDKLGLVHEIERDLDSLDILHTTEGAEMDDNGHVDLVIPEVDQYTPTPDTHRDDPNTAEKGYDGSKA